MFNHSVSSVYSLQQSLKLVNFPKARSVTKPLKQISPPSPAEYKDTPQQREIKSREAGAPDSAATGASTGVLGPWGQQRGAEAAKVEPVSHRRDPQRWARAKAVCGSAAHAAFHSCHFINEKQKGVKTSFHCTLLCFSHKLKINCVLLIKFHHNKPISETH